ncbi:hypothetical protein ACG7TL_007997 [Trametes sanguinea]
MLRVQYDFVPDSFACRFMDGMIPHKDIETNKKYWFRACDDETRALLSRQLIHAFSNKQITCIEYDELTDDQEREIFQRVQLGVALTTAERMQAIPGPWPALIREVQSMVLGDDGFGEDLDWGHDRGRDFACLASIIHLIDLHPTTIFPSVPRLEKWLSSTKPVPAKTREEVLETFRIFVALVRDKRYNRAFSRPARVSPIEFTMIGVLIYRFRKTHSLMQLSSAIWLLRADVRKKHADIRSNQKVTNTMFKFLTKELPNADLVGDGKGDIPATVAIKSYVEGSIGATTEKALSPAGEKRRRLQQTASSDSEGEPVPRKRPSLSGASSLPNGTTTASTSSTRAKATSSKKSISSTSAVASSKSAEKATMKAISRATKSTPASKTAPVRTASSASKSPATTTTNASQSTGRVTTRTTRTAAAAAADALALAQAIESSSADLQPFLSEQAVKKRSRISNRDRNEEPSQSATVDQLPTAPSIKDTEPTAAHARPDVITSNTESSAEVNGVQTSEGQTTVSPTRIIVANPDTQARRSVAQSTPVATTPTEKASQDSVEQLLVKHGQPESTTSRHTVESSSGPSQSSSMAPVQPAASNLRPPTSPLAMVPPPPPPPLFLASTAKNGATRTTGTRIRTGAGIVAEVVALGAETAVEAGAAPLGAIAARVGFEASAMTAKIVVEASVVAGAGDECGTDAVVEARHLNAEGIVIEALTIAAAGLAIAMNIAARRGIREETWTALGIGRGTDQEAMAGIGIGTTASIGIMSTGLTMTRQVAVEEDVQRRIKPRAADVTAIFPH